ncbi:MAG: nitrilase-related carbon-nitrogen hydrolase [Planctomycetota bacterium]
MLKLFMIKVALISMKHVAGNFEANLARHEYWLGKVKRRKPDFVGFPEFSMTGWIYENGLSLSSKYIKGLEQLAKKFKVFLGAGFVEKRQGKLFNSCLIAGPKGRVGIMRKVNLVPAEVKHYTNGREFPVFNLNGYMLAVATCADATRYEMIHMPALRGADIIFAPHANTLGRYGGNPKGWIKWRKERWPLYAKDASIYIAGVNNAGLFEGGKGENEKKYCGGGMVIDCNGEILNSIDKKSPSEDIIIQDLDLASARKKRSGCSLLQPFQAAAIYNRKSGWDALMK